MHSVEIWTDGSTKGNPGPGGWAVILKSGEHDKQLFGHVPDATNQQMELRAAIEGLRALKRPCKVTLYSDSEYIVKGMSEGWIEKWTKNGWKTSAKKPVKNQELWKQLHSAAIIHQVEWVWVKGHHANIGNNQADALAYVAARCEQ